MIHLQVAFRNSLLLEIYSSRVTSIIDFQHCQSISEHSLIRQNINKKWQWFCKLLRRSSMFHFVINLHQLLYPNYFIRVIYASRQTLMKHFRFYHINILYLIKIIFFKKHFYARSIVKFDSISKNIYDYQTE